MGCFNMNISEELLLEEINFLLEEVNPQVNFENEMVVYGHMLADREQSQWWSTVGPSYEEDYNYEEWN